MTSSGGANRLVGVAALTFGLLLVALLWAAASLGLFSAPATTTTSPLDSYDKRPTCGNSTDQPDAVALVRPVKTTLPETDLLYGGDVRPVGPSPDTEGEPQDLLKHHSGHFRLKMAAIWDPHPQYEFSAFGRVFRLSLAHDSSFVLPDIKVTHIWENTSKLEHLGMSADGCFYTGHVIGDPQSSVAVSLCHGMTGHIGTSDGSYFIEPIEEWRNPNEVVTHKFYRVRSSKMPQPSLTLPRDDLLLDYSDTSRRRSKRSSTEQEYNIEIMVVADRTMVEYHGTDGVKEYILVLMNTVAKIYKDASIGNPVNIAVVKLFVLQDVKLVTSHHSYDGVLASEMLSNFCNWQIKLNDPDDNSKNHHDCALLLTRENLCRDLSGPKPNCETLGMAGLGTMCASSGCALVEDNGLNAAFTIAHELGHVLNMPHDSDPRCSMFHGVEPVHGVMSKNFGPNTNPWVWSKCSRHYLTEFLEGGYAECLLDQPGTNQLGDLSLQHPHGVDRQCELVYGKDYKRCLYMPMCNVLWCTSINSQACRTQHMPWADGTPCGTHQWCQRGNCVTRNLSALQPVDGGWAEWQPFEECSRSCSGGISKSFRECDNPAPANGGRYCIGQRVRYRSCNTQECPPATPNFREEQCAKYNFNNLSIPGVPADVKWVPKYGGIAAEDHCKLYCQVLQSSSYFLLRDKVIDGTMCSPETYDICVNGICRTAGCDHVLGSTSQLDYCGQCGGNNSSCQPVSGSYNTSQYGYSKVLRIPAGSSNIDIRQHGYRGSYKDDNYLALIDGDTGEYILNGHLYVKMYRTVIFYGGTTLEYTGSDAVIERINSSRPMNKDLVIEVLSVGHLYPPDIRYAYTVQLTSLAQYVWQVADDWSACDQVCDGESKRVLVCVRSESRQEVPSDLCNGLERPKLQTQACNRHCVLRWQISKSECSSHCGEGTVTVSVQCVQQLNDMKVFAVHNSSCSHLALPPPHERCVGPCDKAYWQFSEWASCSKTCGNGVQRRAANCVNNFNEMVNEKECRESEKIVERACGTQNCPHWAFGEWAPCSVTCGSGERIRPYWCQLGSQAVTTPDICGKDLPHDKEPCHLDDCAIWVAGDWSACSVSCGVGITSRSVVCSIVDACSQNSKPPDTETCSLHPCSLQHENAINAIDYRRYAWKTEDWQPCSVTCGEGMKRREIVCFDEVAHKITSRHYCSHLEKPNTESGCRDRTCASWRVGEWSSCSATCGQGEEKRAVGCMRGNQEVEPRECSTPKPEDQRACRTQCLLPSNTFKWRTGAWSDCSEKCGSGKMTRKVVCQDELGEITLIASDCEESKPVSTVTCNLHPCTHDASWLYGDWSECNQTCGRGYQHRQVRCQSPRWAYLEDSACQQDDRPSHTRPCNTHPCHTTRFAYRWKAQEWSKCSVSCGRGVQSRSVACQQVSSVGWVDPVPVSASLCNASIRPHTQRPCQLTSCQAMFSWVPHEWQTCSHTCGKKGRQIRRLYCYRKDGTKVKRKNCPKQLRPQRKRKCNQKKCGFESCKDLQQKANHRADKEYTITVAGRNLSIYCHGMNTVEPVEFISLPAGEYENYAEFYGNRLIKPDSCPYDGQRRDPCYDCTNDNHTNRAGLTLFSKVRLDIPSLKIISDDWTFSQQIRGKRIPFGEAGDCYSRAQCPQGRFSINLKGTGLQVAPNIQWKSYGHSSSPDINKLEGSRKVIGKCGGFCGTCSPELGLKLDVLPP